MRGQIYAVSLVVGLCAGTAHAANTQQTQTDYQRIMNSANDASSGAFGQPQADPDAIDSSGNPAPNGNTSTATPGTNTANNLPLANQQQIGNSFGTGNGVTTTTGNIGLGSYNSSPYNSPPTTGANSYGAPTLGRGAVTPAFTGQ